MVNVMKTAIGRIGSGNVFADLGLPHPEVLLQKARLASKIDDAIIDRGLSADEASAVTGMSPESLSDLRNGRTRDYGADHLRRVLDSLSSGAIGSLSK
jgi:predicted XRE-type DNA-binding protein